VPDIYQTSLTLIVYFISIISKLSLVFFLIYFFTFDFFNFVNIFFFYPFLIVTLILGAIKGLIQTNLKRIFAYSSFIHLSFILLSLFYLPFVLNNQTFYAKNFN
jgi:NADH:ubiquinone oxidoreductase subunit 2 (subunit N)